MRFAEWIKLITASVLGIILVGLVLICLAALSQPAQASPAPADTPLKESGLQPPQRPPAQSGDLTISKRAATQADPANGGTVSAGGFITYEVTIQNVSGLTITNVVITDQLPVESLTNITCLGSTPAGLSCAVIQRTDSFTTKAPDGSGNDITVTIQVDDKVRWTINQLGPGQTAVGRFSGQAACRSAGQVFTNFALVNFTGSQGQPGFQVSNLVNTQILADVPNANGQPAVSRSPTFCSTGTDTGGFYDMDWGDYDADGDMDLLLVSGNTSAGVVVYRNDGNQFTRIPIYSRIFLNSARWGDFNNDGRLDIVITGYWDSADNQGPSGLYPYTGYNHVFINQGGDNFTRVQNGTDSSGQWYTFQTNDGAFRSATINYNTTTGGFVDVAVGNFYDITNGCAIQVNRNFGAPNYFTAVLDAAAWAGPNVQCLLTEARIQGLAWGDYNNDDYPDLAASVVDFNGTNRVLVFRNNSGGSFTQIFNTSDFVGASGPPNDVRWGDYNNDGWLDLAVALGAQARIYNNNNGTLQTNAAVTIPRAGSGTIRAIDWLDFDGDGVLELAIAEDNGPIRIYEVPGFGTFTELPIPGSGAIYSLRGVDVDNDGDLDIAYTNFGERAFVFTTDSAYLSRQVTSMSPALASIGVDIGKINGGGLGNFNDLAFASNGGNRVYFNNNSGQFSTFFDFVVPSNDISFGDLESDGDLDVAAGTGSSNLVYRYNSGYALAFNWRSIPQLDSRALIFKDFDQDNSGTQDLAVANNNGPNTLYMNSGLLLTESSPSWSSAESEGSRGIAWGYFNNDVMPDIAIANNGGANRVYIYSGKHGFDRVNWTPSIANDNTRAVAWGDYDGDGDMDLAVGNYGQRNYIYQNQNGALSTTPVWSSTETFNTTSLAWGDWNNDGDLDLAVGNDNGNPDQVYANLGSTPGSPRLFWLWQSNSSNNTQDIGWGDIDGDGDLDLAVAGTQSGYYKNGYVLPGHLNRANMLLPLNSSYLSIQRPTPSSGQIWYRTTLSNPASLVIPVRFTVYDPDGSGQNGSRNNLADVSGAYAAGTPQIEYSVDGGSNWQTAAGAAPTFGGGQYTFNWQAGQDLADDKAASDDVRLRVTITHQNKQGLVQRATSKAVSPPFRVRNLSCVWPESATITYQPVTTVAVGEVMTFTGSAIGGGDGPAGQIFYNWDFGNGVISQGVIMFHSFSMTGTPTVSLTVTGSPCPVTRPDFISTTILVGDVGFSGPLTGTVFLPIIQKSGSASPISAPATQTISDFGSMAQNPGLSQITELIGELQAGQTRLQWSPGPADQAILGYRIYRAPAGTVAFQLLAEVPASQTGYTDNQSCGQSYFVTAYNAQGESLPSASSYFNPPCP